METKRRQTDYDAVPDVVGLSLGLLGLPLPRSDGLALLVHLFVGVVQLQKRSRIETFDWFVVESEPLTNCPTTPSKPDPWFEESL